MAPAQILRKATEAQNMRRDNSINLDTALHGAARAFADKACLVTPEATITFDGFYRAAAGAADALGRCGIKAGDRVAILDVNSAPFLIALAAIARLGAVAVPLNYRYRAAEHGFQLEDSGASLLLHGERYGGIAETLSKDLRCGATSVEDLTRARPDRDPFAEESKADPHAPFAICYTSGTTGRPKGAVISQHVFLTRAYKLMLELRLDATDVAHFTTPMFHISCLILGLMAVVRGCTQLILPQFDRDTTMDAIRGHRVTFANMVPTILDMIVSDPEYAPAAFGDLRMIMYTAAPMPMPLLKRVMADYRGGLVQFLGQTEDLPQTALTAEDHRAALDGKSHLLDSVGRPSMGVELKICDDNGNDVEAGNIGEIVTRTGTAMNGYWNLPEDTAVTLREGWIHSGDLGRVDAEGYVYLAGRKKHMIIRGGENIYPAEVEQVLLTAPGVRDGIVLGIPDPRWGEIVIGAVVPDPGRAPDAKTIIAHCRQRLAGYKCPDRIVFCEALPYNAAGKVERHKLRAQLAGDP